MLESETIDDFARALSLTAHDVKNLKMIFNSVEQGDFRILSAIGLKVRNESILLIFFFNLHFYFPGELKKMGN